MQEYIIYVDKIILHSQSVRYTSRGGRAMSYANKDYLEFKKNIVSQMMPQLDKIELKKQALKVKITFEFPMTNEVISFYKKHYKLKNDIKKIDNKLFKKWIKTSHFNGIFNVNKISRPDVDNMAKSMLDALSGVVYLDDQYITDLHLIKKYTNNIDEKRIKIIIELDKIK